MQKKLTFGRWVREGVNEALGRAGETVGQAAKQAIGDFVRAGSGAAEAVDNVNQAARAASSTLPLIAGAIVLLAVVVLAKK